MKNLIYIVLTLSLMIGCTNFEKPTHKSELVGRWGHDAGLLSLFRETCKCGNYLPEFTFYNDGSGKVEYIESEFFSYSYLHFYSATKTKMTEKFFWSDNDNILKIEFENLSNLNIDTYYEIVDGNLYMYDSSFKFYIKYSFFSLDLLENRNIYNNEEIENNDDFYLANWIPVDGTEVKANLDAQDEDIYCFTADGHGKYNITLKWVSGENLDLVGKWYAYNASKYECPRFFTLNENGNKENEYDLLRNGEYFSFLCYLKISNFTDTLTDSINTDNAGEYTITVNKVLE